MKALTTFRNRKTAIVKSKFNLQKIAQIHNVVVQTRNFPTIHRLRRHAEQLLRK